MKFQVGVEAEPAEFVVGAEEVAEGRLERVSGFIVEDAGGLCASGDMGFNEFESGGEFVGSRGLQRAERVAEAAPAFGGTQEDKAGVLGIVVPSFRSPGQRHRDSISGVRTKADVQTTSPQCTYITRGGCLCESHSLG